MVLDYQAFTLSDIEEVEEIVINPEIRQLESKDRYGKFAIEPLDPGYGMTLGNPLRRVLYGSLTGTAVTWVKVESVLHEYATISHMKEEVSEFLLNVKGIRLRSESDRPGQVAARSRRRRRSVRRRHHGFVQLRGREPGVAPGDT